MKNLNTERGAVRCIDWLGALAFVCSKHSADVSAAWFHRHGFGVHHRSAVLKFLMFRMKVRMFRLKVRITLLQVSQFFRLLRIRFNLFAHGYEVPADLRRAWERRAENKAINGVEVFDDGHGVVSGDAGGNAPNEKKISHGRVGGKLTEVVSQWRQPAQPARRGGRKLSELASSIG
jgi:hypothetical protein